MPDQATIRAEGLTKRFGDTVALAGVDLEVPAGSILAVLGPERRRQDHRRPHPHHTDRPTPAAPGSPATTSCATRPQCSAVSA